MSAEANKAIARRGWQSLNEGNLEVIGEVYASECVYHEPGGDIHGAEGVKQYVGMILSAFPDLQITVEDEISEGEMVVHRWTMRGTHQGDLMGIPASGNQVSMSGITIARIEGGKIAEEWEMPDNLGMMQQLGVIPTPEQAGA